MNHKQLHDEVINTLRFYWRIRAALAYFRAPGHAESPVLLGVVEYCNVPTCGVASNFTRDEPLAELLRGLRLYEETRLNNDIFLALIAKLEVFLSSVLAEVPLTNTGTLGELQRRAEKHFKRELAVEVNLIDEIRERRNVILHHHGSPTDKYRAAAARAVAPSAGNVADPTTVTALGVTPGYLAYVADSIIRYCNLYPSSSDE